MVTYPTLSDFTVNNLVLAQFYFQGPSGLPTDRFVTTTFWRDDAGAGLEAVQQKVGQAWDDFLSFTGSGGSKNLGGWIPGQLQGPYVKCYDLSVPPPRTPADAGLTWSFTQGTGDPLPREVAIVCSYHNGGPGPRNRGRFYFGPLTSDVVQDDATTGRTSPQNQVRVGLAEAMANWVNNPPAGITWMQLSRVNQQPYPVGGGFVDDAFDTQRSRGEEPNARSSFGVDPSSGVGGPPGGKSDPYTGG